MTFALLPALLAISSATLCAQSNITSARPFAYGAGTGWIHLRPSAADGVQVSEYHLSGHAYGANTGWINFGNGALATGHVYTNTSAGDCGVNHDGAGNLSGYAWSANTGWINFSWTHLSDPNRPRFDLLTGEFAGFVWSLNMGWINLGAGFLQTNSILRPDTDGDGIGDEWEMAYSGNLTAFSATGDYDHDGFTDAEEYRADTNPLAYDGALELRPVTRADVAGGTALSMEWTTRPARLYRLDTSTTMAAGSWSAVAQFTGTGSLLSTTHIAPGPRRFYQIVPLRPLLGSP